jgi:hypothetical protein
MKISPMPISLGSFLFVQLDKAGIEVNTNKDRFIKFCNQVPFENMLPSEISDSVIKFLRIPQIGNYATITGLISNWKLNF